MFRKDFSSTFKPSTFAMQTTFTFICSVAVLLVSCADGEITQTRQTGDPSLATLSAVVQQLAQKVEALEAERNSMRGQLEEFDIILNQLNTKLAEKRCESGSKSFNPHDEGHVIHHDGSEGTFDERQIIEHVDFSQAFATVPAVTAGLVHIDAEHTANTRIDVSVQNVTASGFDFVVAEWWYDTHNYAINVMWMACSN